MLARTRGFSGSVNLVVSVKLCSDNLCCHGNEHLEISTENSPFVVIWKLPPTGNWGRQRQTPPRLRPRRVSLKKIKHLLRFLYLIMGYGLRKLMTESHVKEQKGLDWITLSRSYLKSGRSSAAHHSVITRTVRGPN